MELVENYSPDYKYLTDEKSSTFILLDRKDEISDSYSIYDSLFDFLNYDFRTIQSALEELYNVEGVDYDKFQTLFKIIEQELFSIFKINTISANSRLWSDNITLHFINNDYTEFTIHSILLMRDNSKSIDIECVRDKYFRFLLGVYSMEQPCKKLIDKGTMEELREAFQDYYLYIEDLYYTKIYPIFFLHTIYSYALSLQTPPYRLTYMKQQILESFSANITYEEVTRIKTHIEGDKKNIQTKAEAEYLAKKDSYLDQSEHGNAFKRWRFDFVNPPSENDLYDYYNAGWESITYDSKDLPSVTMPVFYCPIKIAIDFWYPNKKSEECSESEETNAVDQQCFLLEYIEDIFILHCHFFIKSHNHIGRCPNCHKIKYSAKKTFSCGGKCDDQHRQNIIRNTSAWKNYDNFRKKNSNRLKKVKEFYNQRDTGIELENFLPKNFKEILNIGDSLFHLMYQISDTDYDNTLYSLNKLSDRLYKIHKLYTAPINGTIEYDQQKIETECKNIAEDINTLSSHIASLEKPSVPQKK